MFDNSHVRVLTAKGGPHAIQPALYDYIALTSDKKLYFHEEYRNNRQVANKIAFFTEAKLYEGLPIPVTAIEIRSLYDKSLKESNESSQLQREVQDLFERAAAQDASDVHVTVRSNETIVKLRVIGDVEPQHEYTSDHGWAMCKTIFMTMCDQTGKTFQPNKPQEARMKQIYLPDGITGVRIQTNKTIDGFIMVCRLLKKMDQTTMTLEKMGYEDSQIQLIKKARSKKGGINIIAGPTGSGKSSTLATNLSEMIEDDNGSKHIVTIENPVEYQIGGRITIFKKEEPDKNFLTRIQEIYQTLKRGDNNFPELLNSDFTKIRNMLKIRIYAKWKNVLDSLQTQQFAKININELQSLMNFSPFIVRSQYLELTKIDYATQIPVMGADAKRRREKFGESVSSLMRLDPDTVMIGEIRDGGSLKAASDASRTGHQVWSTVHATTAMGIPKRLITVGNDSDERVTKEDILDPDVLSSLISQRLVKKLCPNCSIPLNVEVIEEPLLDRLNKVFKNDLSGIRIKGDGCLKCNQTGNVGRTVVAEIIVVDEKFVDLLINSSFEAQNYWVKDMAGMTMMMHGLLKVKRGDVDPADLEDELEQINIREDWHESFAQIIKTNIIDVPKTDYNLA